MLTKILPTLDLPIPLAQKNPEPFHFALKSNYIKKCARFALQQSDISLHL